MTSEPIDLLIDDARFILSQDADRTLLERASIAVKGNRIVAVGDAGELRRNYNAERTIDASERMVSPGFVNAHSHDVKEHTAEEIKKEQDATLTVPYVDMCLGDVVLQRPPLLMSRSILQLQYEAYRRLEENDFATLNAESKAIWERWAANFERLFMGREGPIDIGFSRTDYPGHDIKRVNP